MSRVPVEARGGVIVTLPEASCQAIIAHAMATPEVEVCGLVGCGADGRVSVYPVANVADEPRVAYLMEPRAQIAVMRTMRNLHQQLFAIYHSHPRAPAEPSPTDLALAAYPGALQLIVSLARRDAPELRAWNFEDGGCTEVELRIS